MTTEPAPDFAIPGDPFLRPQYHDGMLLAASDFEVEQRQALLRHRLHQVLLHGFGTVAGLSVERIDDQLRVSPGWAIDELGRDLWVDTEQCLNASDLDVGEHWVLLRYEACQGRPVLAGRRACAPRPNVTYSRWRDGFRIDLVSDYTPSETPFDALVRNERVRWLDDILSSGEQLDRLWSQPEMAPLVLAKIHVQAVPGQRATITTVDNQVRAILPRTQQALETLAGVGLRAPAPPSGFVVARSAVEPEGPGGVRVTYRLTADVDARSYAGDGGVAIYLLLDQWERVEPDSYLIESHGRTLVVRFVLDPAPVDARWQIVLTGQGARPLMDTSGRPLAGHALDPHPNPPTGRDFTTTGIFASPENS